MMWSYKLRAATGKLESDGLTHEAILGAYGLQLVAYRLPLTMPEAL